MKNFMIGLIYFIVSVGLAICMWTIVPVMFIAGYVWYKTDKGLGVMTWVMNTWIKISGVAYSITVRWNIAEFCPCILDIYETILKTMERMNEDIFEMNMDYI